MGERRTSEIGACAWRLSRLVTNGTPDYENPIGALVVCGGITAVTHSYEVEAGQQLFQRDSCGAACVNVVRDGIEKWINGTITLCKDDYRIWELLGLAALFEGATGQPPVGRGMTMAAGCATTTKPRVALELWVENYDCDELDAEVPYHRHTFTNTKFEPQGYDIGSDPSLPVFAFKGFNNSNFADGPFNDLDVLVANAFAGAYTVTDDTELPDCPDPFDYVALPAAAS